MNVYDHFLVSHADASVVETRLIVEVKDFADDTKTFRWVLGPEPIIANDSGGTSRTWLPGPATVSGISTQLGQVAGTAQVAIANEGNFLSAAIADRSIKLRQITVGLAWLDPDVPGVVAGTVVTLAACAVQGLSLARGLVTIRLSPSQDLSRIPYPPRRLQPRCQAVYKSGFICNANGTLAVCNLTPSTSGGCGDVNTRSSGPTVLELGHFGGFFLPTVVST